MNDDHYKAVFSISQPIITSLSSVSQPIPVVSWQPHSSTNVTSLIPVISPPHLSIANVAQPMPIFSLPNTLIYSFVKSPPPLSSPRIIIPKILAGCVKNVVSPSNVDPRSPSQIENIFGNISIITPQTAGSKRPRGRPTSSILNAVSPAKRKRGRPKTIKGVAYTLFCIIYLFFIILIWCLDAEYIGRALQSLDDIEIVEEHYIGKMDRECKYCCFTEEGHNPALYFPNELISSLCCSNGKALVLPLKRVYYLEHIIRSKSIRRKYLDNIREINNALAFMSLGVNLEMPATRGPFVFRIHGQIYHRIGNLVPPANTAPKYASLYIIDPKEALSERLKLSENQKINKILLRKLHNFLANSSPYVRAFRHMYEVEENEIMYEFNICTDLITLYFTNTLFFII